MAKKFSTLTTVLGASALLLVTACGEGSDEPADGGDGDGDMTATGDGDMTATGDGDMTTGDGDMTTGDGDMTTGDGDMSAGGPTVQYDFGGDLEGLSVDWEEPDTWSSSNGMGGAGSVSMLEWTDADGDPDAGAAELTVDFDYTGTGMDSGLHKVHLAVGLDGATDLSGTVVSARIKLVSGADEMCPVNGKLFVKSGDTFVWADGGAINLVEGAWADATFAGATPSYEDPGFDSADVVQVGIEITPSNDPTCTTGEVVVRVDSISY